MSGTRNTSQGDIHGTQIQIGSAGAGVSIHQPEVRTVRILPQRETSVFQNRTEELALLDTFLERAESGAGGWLWSIVGGPALGKTTLALTWIIQNRHRFSHAQLAVACGGGPGQDRGRGAEQVCDEYFHAVGVDTDAPGFDTLEGKLNLFRQHTADKPVVVLLDDVRSAAQVEPFLSDLPGTVVITTSREPVRDLGMRRPAAVQVGPLADEAIIALFEDVLGPDRRTAEPRAFARLVDLCGGIPLFAGHAAALLYDVADLSVAELAERLEEHGRIDFLEEVSEVATRPAAVFDVSYRELGPDAARLYRALGTHPTRDFDAWLVRAYFFRGPRARVRGAGGAPEPEPGQDRLGGPLRHGGPHLRARGVGRPHEEHGRGTPALPPADPRPLPVRGGRRRHRSTLEARHAVREGLALPSAGLRRRSAHE